MGVALCPQIQCSVRIAELANYVHVCKYVHEGTSFRVFPMSSTMY